MARASLRGSSAVVDKIRPRSLSGRAASKRRRSLHGLPAVAEVLGVARDDHLPARFAGLAVLEVHARERPRGEHLAEQATDGPGVGLLADAADLDAVDVVQQVDG